MNDFDRRVAAIAARQYGAITRAQAREAGGSDAAIDRRAASGRWEPLLAGVFRIGGAPDRVHQRAMAACLWAGVGAVLSHRSAGALYRLDAVAAGSRAEVTVPGGRSPRSRLVVVHRTLTLPPTDRRVVDGIPATAPARTIIDLASVLREEALEAAFESARRAGLLLPSHVARRLEDLGGSGRPGSARLRRVLDAHRPGDRPLESRLEVRLARLLRGSGLPRPVRQQRVAARSARYRLDFAWPDRMVAVECDGWDAHGGRLAWRRDRRRLSVLSALGWRVVHVTWDEVTREPAATLGRIAAALAVAA